MHRRDILAGGLAGVGGALALGAVAAEAKPRAAQGKDRPMNLSYDATSRTLATPAGTLHYHEAGEGPVLLMLHGSGPGVSGWANFGDNLPVFAPHFRTIILDAPGYGKSDAVAGDPIGAGVAAVGHLLDGLGIARASIIGNSYGAMVGGQFAAASPAKVERFVAIGGIGYSLTSPFPPEGINRLVDFVEDPTRDKLRAWLETMVYNKALVTPELIEARYTAAIDPKVMESSRKMYTRQSIAAIAEGMRGSHAAERLAYLAKIEAPTLITWGRDDRVTPVDGAFLPMRMVRNAELHIFPNCGHWSMIECKDRFEGLVLDFLGVRAG